MSQVTADFCYLFSAIFYMYVAWKYFDPRETEAYTTNPALVEEAVGTSSDTASLDGDVQLVATHKTDSEDVHVTLLPDSLSPGAAYGTARIVDDRPQTRRVYDVKAAHVELLKWVFCCGCRRQVPQTQFY